MKNKIICFALLLFVMCTGVYVRTEGSPDCITSNTASFFYARARDLQVNNQYPLEDRLNYAPEVFKEDYPPFPAYFAVGVYRLVSFFCNVSFHHFIVILPVLMYVILFVAGFFIVANLYGKLAGFFFAILLTIIPAASLLTQKGYYTEEALGVFLIILFFFFFIKSKKNNKYVYLAITALTLLSLTWQIFLWVFAGVLVHLMFYRKKLTHHLLILILPLLVGHIISVNIIGLDYSPVYMLKEAYVGYKYESSEDFKIAFDRVDLRPIGFQKYTEDFTYLGLIFSVLGLFVCLKNLKKHEYATLLVYSILGFTAVIKYVKFRFFSLVFIIMLSSLGMSYAYNFDIVTRLRLKGYFKKLRKYSKKILKVLVIILLILAGILTVQHIRNPECEITLILPEEKIEIGRVYDITLQIENIGEGALCRKDAFSGVHIEVENASVLEKKAYSSITKGEVAEKGYTTDQIGWFEAKFDCLKHNNKGRVTFSIKPYALPVKLNYRCWIPQFCLRPPPKEILPEFKMAWRNEKCLHRKPSEGSLCSVPVYAGYVEKQDYYCKSVIL